MQYLQVVATIIGNLTVICGAIAVVCKFWNEQKRVREGQKCLLRAEMIKIYHHGKESKTIRQYEAENFISMYCAYKAMGGNSFIDEIYDHVTQWKLEA